jgi:hypothetical protein
VFFRVWLGFLFDRRDLENFPDFFVVGFTGLLVVVYLDSVAELRPISESNNYSLGPHNNN